MPSLFFTGASGLVGARMLPRLVDAGFDCRALVRNDVNLPAGATAVRGDLLEPDSFRSAVEGVDAIVHLAAFFRSTDEDAIWRANRDGTRNLVDVAKAHAPQARFVMASTGNVYNADATRPACEDDECNPTAAYGASKIAAEALLRDSGLTWAILRLPFVYGEDDGHIASMPTLAKQFGLHPGQTFSLAHHQDIAAAFKLALSGSMDGRVVNVTDDAPLSIYEMVELVGESIEGSSEPLKNPWSGRLNGTRLRGLGFKPAVATVRQAARDGIL